MFPMTGCEAVMCLQMSPSHTHTPVLSELVQMTAAMSFGLSMGGVSVTWEEWSERRAGEDAGFQLLEMEGQ